MTRVPDPTVKDTADAAFIQTAPVPYLPPPTPTRGWLAWTKANLFAGPWNSALTILTLLMLLWVVPPVVRFLVIDAVWTGGDREACLVSADRPAVGACWAFVRERFAYFVYGSYPRGERWRVDIFFVMLAIGIGWLLKPKARRGPAAVYFFAFLPVASFILLYGLPTMGLPIVDTALWGGVLVTIVVATVGIVISLPLGILLALGRRSRMPAVKLLCVMFIEFVRGVPLITVLFMASVMLPLFVPPAWSPDKLIRALAGIALFSSAYMAEVIRAGLQAIPKGQYEAAHALGLSSWQSLRFVILPQALQVTIPNIVNSYVALFKDTTLVFFVGLFDFLKTIEVARADPKWATPVTSATGYAFAAIFYFLCCYSMSRYADRLERRLARAERPFGRLWITR